MAVVNGEVNTTVNVRQTGNASNVDDAAKSVRGLNQSMDGLKAGVAPVNKVREGFEQLRSNAAFLVGGVTAVVGAISALAEAFDTSGKKLERWAAQQAAVNATLTTTASLLDDVDVYLGRTASTSVTDKIEAVQKKWAEVVPSIEEAEEALRAYQERFESGKWTKEGWDDFHRGWADAQTKLTELVSQRSHLEDVNTALIKRQSAEVAYQRQEYEKMFRTIFNISELPAPKVLRKTNALDAWGDVSSIYDPQFSDNPTQSVEAGVAPSKPKLRGGGGGREQTKEEGLDALFGRGKFAPKERPTDLDALLEDLGMDGIDQMIANAKPNDRDVGMGPEAASKMITDFDLMTEAALRFNDALGPLLNEMLPGLGDSIGGISSIMEAYADSTGKSAKAQVAAFAMGSVAVAGGIGKILGGKKGMWIAESIAETGYAAASLAVGDFWGFAQHGIAATTLGAAAAAAGGGGGAKGGAGGGGGRGGFSRPLSNVSAGGGSPTIIINGDWNGNNSPQETAAELHARLQQGRSSGYVP